jgi:hypothetical protein
VKVDRATRLGNPFRVGEDGTAAQCQALYRGLLSEGAQPRAAAPLADQERARTAALAELERLRGKDLACWCTLCARHAEGRPAGEACEDCAPCHGDVLLEFANR